MSISLNELIDVMHVVHTNMVLGGNIDAALTMTDAWVALKELQIADGLVIDTADFGGQRWQRVNDMTRFGGFRIQSMKDGKWEDAEAENPEQLWAEVMHAADEWNRDIATLEGGG